MFLYALNCNATIIILKTSKIAVFLHKNTLYKKRSFSSEKYFLIEKIQCILVQKRSNYLLISIFPIHSNERIFFLIKKNEKKIGLYSPYMIVNNRKSFYAAAQG